jgi:hypothetical protein
MGMVMTSTRFACPGEAGRLRDYADQLERIGRQDAAALWRELADRVEAHYFAEIMETIEEVDHRRVAASEPGS